MKYWKIYTTCIKRNCANNAGKGNDLAYWRDNLFASAIIYLLPFCLIALLPAIYWVFVTRQYIIAMVDVVALAAMLVVAVMPGIGLPGRKIIFIISIYLFSCALLYLAGLAGPGLLYLLATCVLSILIFPNKYSFWPAWLNTAICLLCAVAIKLKLIAWPPGRYPATGEWIAVSINLVFVSFLFSALIPRLFNGLQKTINNEKQLKDEVNRQQQHLQQALHMLQQKNNELEQFAYVASHDLKEPLRMVTSFMGLLKTKYGSQLNEKAHTYIGFALDGGRRMQRMIDDLLELSRTARIDTVKEDVDMGGMLNEAKQNIFKLIEDSRAEIIVKAQMPVLAVYKTGIGRLLQNLLINAIKFSKNGIPPVINVSVTEAGDEWLFCIKDNGIGIEQAQCEKVFDIFTRLHPQQMYEGTGMGLAICKKIVERHGGHIWVTSEEGTGSNFYFTIKKLTQ